MRKKGGFPKKPGRETNSKSQRPTRGYGAGFKGREHHRPNETTAKKDTSWQSVAGWYNKLVGEEGQYFHQRVILPSAVNLLEIGQKSSLLDLACGQGILSRHIPQTALYHGVDLARDLVNYARSQSQSRQHEFTIADITKPLPVSKKDFSHASIILALQNVENIASVFKNAANHLVNGGRFLIVINHPAFRIPRQSSWGIDESKKTQYRRIDRYMSPIKIPINMNPGHSSGTKLTWSFHNPMSVYAQELKNAGFYIETIEEWVSEKESQGKAAKMENRARSEFPMFMAILAVKK
jgi:ubiquinone/menaquinone biosynthesis C-methylase UbiE